mmetsp:Transcript_95188/g.268939  ORF Transcript_95188/g.268939 Transcript_95188/m.268939 type:complete len:105 (+) Transcript_95188:1116-1430(+)
MRKKCAQRPVELNLANGLFGQFEGCVVQGAFKFSQRDPTFEIAWSPPRCSPEWQVNGGLFDIIPFFKRIVRFERFRRLPRQIVGKGPFQLNFYLVLRLVQMQAA